MYGRQRIVVFRPVVPCFCAFALVALLQIDKNPYMLLALIFLIAYQFRFHGFRQGFFILVCVFCAALWIHFRLSAQISSLPENCTMRRQLLIQRCTWRQQENYTRVYGFAKIKPGEIPIYFNLKLSTKLPIPHRGQFVNASFRLQNTASAERNFEKYLAGVGIRYRAYDGRILGIARESPFNRAIIFLTERASQALACSMDVFGPLARIYHGMLLGDRSTMTAYEKSVYSRTGIAHLFAISGLHIGIIGWVMYALTKGINRYPVCIFLLRVFALYIFVQMTGGSPSSWRAFSMVSIFWLAPFIYRKSDSLSSLLFSALLSLIANPLNILNTSFQLSYGVVFSLLCYGMPLARYLRRQVVIFRRPRLFEKRQPWIRFMRRLSMRSVDALALSVAATLPIIPISIYHFQTFSVGGILLNPFVMPLASMAIVAGFISLCLGLFGIWPLCFLINRFASIPLAIIHGCTAYVSRWRWIESWPISISRTSTFLWFAIICASMYASSFRRLRLSLPLLLSAFPLLWLGK
ncbi:MAG: ComEC/Rec2 family competence protein [Puniceicoccales bacterium]|jgi:competence protein ComEC|nr:ComEC/Rec2 family competence protein [Puniceicoccales bacterium]